MPKKKESSQTTQTTHKKKTSAKKVSVNKVTSTEKNDYTKMTDYIQEIYLKRGIDDPPWALLMTQVKDIVNKYGLNYIEILHILQYMIQIEGIDFSEKDTLGLVPYYINKTERYIERYKEIKQSFHIIKKFLKKLEEFNGEQLQVDLPQMKADSFVVSITEGWRGEVVHIAITDEQGRLSRYKIKDPSFNNWCALAMAVRNNGISDFPLCNKSFNLSYCGNDL